MTDETTPQDGKAMSSASAGSVGEVLAKGIANIIRIAAEPDWIPVSERLPNVGRSEYGSVECIVACSTGLVTAMRYTENRNAKTEKGRRPRWEWNWRVATWEVTHWMPLPAPPTDGK
jgi:hypothetical protein